MVSYEFALLFIICNTVSSQFMKVKYSWVYVDYQFSDPQQRDSAIKSGAFIPENCVVLDVDVYQTEEASKCDPNSNNNSCSLIMFVTVPRFKPGVPATLAKVVQKNDIGTTLLAPFPNWKANTVLKNNVNCNENIISVFRTKIDSLGRFWVVDVGTVDQFLPTFQQVCPPKLLIFDLKNGNKIIKTYTFPSSKGQKSLYTNIAVDIRDPEGQNTFAYISDTVGYKLIVYSFKNDESWIVDQAYLYPYPTNAHFIVNGVNFDFMDGVLGTALGPVTNNDRILYFHSYASLRESWVSCSVLQNKSMFQNGLVDGSGKFFVSPEARKFQSTVEVMTKDGFLIFTSMDNSLGSWNSKDKFISENMHCLYRNDEEFQFPTGLKIVGDNIWAVSGQLQNLLSPKPINKEAVKYRVLVGVVNELLKSKGCDL